MMNYTKAKNAITALMCYRDSLQDGYNGPDSVEVAEMAVPIIEDIEEELFSDCQECASRGAKIPMMARKLLFAIHYVANEMCKGVPGGYIPDPFAMFLVRIQNGMLDIYPDVCCEINKDIKAGKGISYELGGFEWSIEELKNIVLQREGQNGGHTEPLRAGADKSNEELVKAFEMAANQPFPDWLDQADFCRHARDGDIIRGNRWNGQVQQLSQWLEPYLSDGGERHKWRFADCLFLRRSDKDPKIWEPVTNINLAQGWDEIKNILK